MKNCHLISILCTCFIHFCLFVLLVQSFRIMNSTFHNGYLDYLWLMEMLITFAHNLMFNVGFGNTFFFSLEKKGLYPIMAFIIFKKLDCALNFSWYLFIYLFFNLLRLPCGSQKSFPRLQWPWNFPRKLI